MGTWDSTVSTLLVRPLVEALAGQPMAQRALLSDAGLTLPMVADSDARISGSQFARAWDAVTRLSGDGQVALRIAEVIPPGAMGVVEYLCRSEATLGQALRQWCRYLNLLNDGVRVDLFEGEPSAVRVVAEHAARAPRSHELCFALLARRARELCGPALKLSRVNFAHPPPEANLARYRELFGAPVHFSAERTELLLPAAALALRLPTGDLALAEILGRYAESLKSQRPSAPPLTAQVRARVRDGLRSEAADIEQVARALALTPRSLQRRLKEEGSTFQAVREGVRRELAGRYLEHDLSFAEISFLLGFSEPSAFFRAYKRWTGRSPEAARAQLRAVAATSH